MVANELFDKYFPIVEIAAAKYARRFYFGTSYDDFIQSGSVGLLDALNSITEKSEGEMYTYVRTRVVGEIIDRMRRESWAGRGTVRKRQQIAGLREGLAQRLLRAPTLMELAAEGGVSLDTLREDLFEVEPPEFVTEDLEEQVDEHSDDPRTVMARESLKVELWEMVDDLSAREGAVIRGLYLHDKTLLQISDELGISESRVCQIKTSALESLMLLSLRESLLSERDRV